MKFYTVYLYARDGSEITSDECEGISAAKKRARCLLSDETTHARLGTMKAAVFSEGQAAGANAVCEWDQFHPDYEDNHS